MKITKEGKYVAPVAEWVGRSVKCDICGCEAVLEAGDKVESSNGALWIGCPMDTCPRNIMVSAFPLVTFVY